MHWWLVITLIIAGALAYGYRTHQRERRQLAGLFSLLCAKYGGELKAGNWLVYPQLRFERKNGHYLVAAMATDGSDSGDSGPFTFVDLELSFDTGRKILLKRSPSNAGSLVDGITPGREPTTGHRVFDEAFQIEGSHQGFASGVLQADVRQKLLAWHRPRLDVRIQGRKISVYMDGIATSKADLEELIDIASLLADHCAASLS